MEKCHNILKNKDGIMMKLKPVSGSNYTLVI